MPRPGNTWWGFLVSDLDGSVSEAYTQLTRALSLTHF